MNKTTWAITIGIILGILIFIGFTHKDKPQVNQPIKIAALLSLTGDYSSAGENAQKAIQLATKEINEKGGIGGRQVEIIYEDTAGDSKKTVSTYQLVTSIDHVEAIIGPLLQSELSAIIPLIDKDNIPTIAPDYISLQNRKNISNPILVWMDAETEANRMAQYVFSQGIRKVGVIGSLDNWENIVSNTFASEFTTLGGTVTDKEIVQPDVSDMKLPITKVLSTNPQAIFLGTYYQFTNSTKELHNLGYKGNTFGIEVDDYLAGQTSGWVSDLKFIAPDYYTNSFVTDFKNEYKIAPGLSAGEAYDATNILFSFLTKSDKKDDILSEMKKFKSHDGVSGQLQIGADGRTTLPTALFDLKNGVITRVKLLP